MFNISLMLYWYDACYSNLGISMMPKDIELADFSCKKIPIVFKVLTQSLQRLSLKAGWRQELRDSLVGTLEGALPEDASSLTPETTLEIVKALDAIIKQNRHSQTIASVLNAAFARVEELSEGSTSLSEVKAYFDHKRMSGSSDSPASDTSPVPPEAVKAPAPVLLADTFRRSLAPFDGIVAPRTGATVVASLTEAGF